MINKQQNLISDRCPRHLSVLKQVAEQISMRLKLPPEPPDAKEDCH